MNWKMALNNWRFGYGQIFLRGEKGTQYYVFKWSESTEEPTIDWSSFDAIEAQTTLEKIRSEEK